MALFFALLSLFASTLPHLHYKARVAANPLIKIGVLHMKKILVLLASVSVLALAGCNKAEEKAAAPAAVEAPAVAAPAAPAAEPAPAVAAPAADAMAPVALDSSVQTMIDQAAATASAMTVEQKTAAVAGIRTAAEAAATAAGTAGDALKAAGDAAEAAAKKALGL